MRKKPLIEKRRTRADVVVDTSAHNPEVGGDSLREKREETEREEGRWEDEGGRQERRPVTSSATEESKRRR